MKIFYQKHRKLVLVPLALLVFAIFWNSVGINSALAHGSFGSLFNFNRFRNFHFSDFQKYFRRDNDNHNRRDDKKEHHKSKDGKLDCGFDGGSIFNVTNMMPGDSEERQLTIMNTANTTVTPILQGTRTGPSGETEPLFESVLDFSISGNATVIYSNKLQVFFADSTIVNNIALTPIAPNQAKDFELKVKFPDSAGNDFQLKEVIFKLKCDKRVVISPTPSPKPTPTRKPHRNYWN